MSSDRSPLILVVDDDPTQRMLMCAALERAGFQCEEAEDGDAGLDRCIALEPDLIILDVVMPGRDGFEVCTEIKNTPQIKAIPVLMTTALNDLQSIERAFEAGAINFQTKPINFSLLGYQVKYILRTSRMEAELRNATQAAEAANNAKSAFLANMSHELRTPLTAIMGFSDIIHKEALGPIGTPQYQGYAGDIFDSASHLCDVINDILDLSKVDSGKLDLEERELHLPELFQSVERLVNHRAQEAGVLIACEINPDFPMLWCDERRLKQVLVNLMHNAIKFTPEGGLAKLKANYDGDVTIEISDDGIGIPSDQVEVALSPFEQVDNGLSRKYEGTGLGLPLAKTITEQIGGTFELLSEFGQGTIITITLPKDRVVASETGSQANSCGLACGRHREMRPACV